MLKEEAYQNYLRNFLVVNMKVLSIQDEIVLLIKLKYVVKTDFVCVLYLSLYHLNPSQNVS